MTTVVLGDPGYFSPVAYPGQGRVAGSGELESLGNAGLTVTNSSDGIRNPQLGTEVPSTSTGSWRVFPDGRMETTATLKPGTLWHDGKPITASDLVFSARVAGDKEVGLPVHGAMELIEGAEALDQRTVVVKWKSPYIAADEVFASFARIIPEHILGTPYANRVSLLELSHWREDFISNGPFKLREYQPQAYALFDAFEGYVLGRPKLDLVEVKFIQDSNVVLANVLAGAITFAPTRTFSFDAAVEASERWPGGRIEIGRGGSNISVYIQFLDPTPAVIANVDFRRALLLGMNRQGLLELQLGRGTISHTTVLGPDSWEYALIEKDIVKYPYDPRRAIELVQALGFTRGGDGAFVNSSTAERLSLELRTTTSEPETRMVQVMAEDWKQIGVPTDTYVIPTQQASDREYRATFPGVQLLNQHTVPQNFHSKDIPTAQNRYVGINRNRITDAQLDSLIDRYFITVPVDERMQVLGRFINRMTDRVITIPTMHRVTAVLVANHLLGLQGTNPWNVHEWRLGGS